MVSVWPLEATTGIASRPADLLKEVVERHKLKEKAQELE